MKLAAKKNNLSHIPPLDGLRGIAILLVLIYHCLEFVPFSGIDQFLMRFVRMGWCGVDLFFVLSGFLITRILIETQSETQYYKAFYARRFLRIFPIYYFFLAIAFVLIADNFIFFRQDRFAPVASKQIWFWFYGQNFFFAKEGWPPVNSYFNHLWSLAVEQQFYLLWPFIVKVNIERLEKICFGIIALALGLRILFFLFNIPWVASFVLFFTRIDALCMGALAAIFINRNNVLQRMPRQNYINGLLIGGLLLILPFPFLRLDYPLQGAPYVYTIGYSALAIFFMALLLKAYYSSFAPPE